MDLSPRKTRAQRRQQLKAEETAPNPYPPPTATTSTTKSPQPVFYQAPNLASFTPQLMRPDKSSNDWAEQSPAEQALLEHKQDLLTEQAATLRASIPKDLLKPDSIRAIYSTLIFAREEAGTAVMIRQDGLILTCAHCVADTRQDFESENIKDKVFWLLESSERRVFRAKCIAWDPVRDLALLGIFWYSPRKRPVPSPTALSAFPPGAVQPDMPRAVYFNHVNLAESSPAVDAPLVCVGHPGAEDLETSRRGVKTGYDVLHVSTGAFRGIAEGQDAQDNEEIGALMHDCWTYWGHSGSPLLDRKTGKLVGLHSSWDDETGMRRGVAIEAINEFLKLCNIDLESLEDKMRRNL
ncbi:Trypsin-like cysteine/serine peptidase domain containing protein [Rhypophila sp. PSN 637]